MNIAALMPCRGRADQTVRNVKRLFTTAGYSGEHAWKLTLIVDGDSDLFEALVQPGIFGRYSDLVDVIASVAWSNKVPTQRIGYWKSLTFGSARRDNAQAPLLCNLANDLLPGMHWLKRALVAHRTTFSDGLGLMGFNDGHHETDHSCHFLISRSLLESYGGWPVWYDHNYGDTELCQRAIADGRYAKAPWATLYHDHPYFGGNDDATYAEGRARAQQDQMLYERRKANGWQS